MWVAILLAAGASRRFGRPNKLMARIGGRTLLARALAIAGRAPAGRLIVVTGAQPALIAREIRRHAPAARIVRAKHHREGMGASLRAAARALRPVDREALLFTADMPAIPTATLRRVLRARSRSAIVRPAWRGVPGHPVLLRGAALARLRHARGDAGLRASGLATTFVRGDAGAVLDIDTPAALARTRRHRLP